MSGSRPGSQKTLPGVDAPLSSWIEVSKKEEAEDFNPRAIPTDSSATEKPASRPSSKRIQRRSARELLGASPESSNPTEQRRSVSMRPLSSPQAAELNPAPEGSSQSEQKISEEIIEIAPIAAQSPAATPVKKVHEPIRKVSKVLGWLALATEGAYEKFTFTSLAPAIRLAAAKALHIKNVSDIVVTPVVGIITAGDAIANFSTIEVNEAADFFGEAFGEGVGPTLKNYAKECWKHPFTVFVPTLACLISFPVGSYADIATIRDWLHEHGPFVEYGAIAIAMTLGTYFYTAAFGKKTLDGYKFMINDVDNGRNPPQKYLYQHFLDGNMAPVVQCLIESMSANLAVRPTTFAYLMKALVEQQAKLEHGDVDYYSKTTSYIWQGIAAAGTLLQCLPQRHPSSYRKFFGTPNRRLDLITPEAMHAAYNLLFRNASIAQKIVIEVKRAFNITGLAESGLVGWGASKLAEMLPELVVSSGSTSLQINSAIEWGAAALAGAAMYTAVFRRASLQTELRNYAFDHPAEIATEVARLRYQARSPLEGHAYVGPEPDHASTQSQNQEAKNSTWFAVILGYMGSYGTNTARCLTNVLFIMSVIDFIPGLTDDAKFWLALAASVVVSKNGIDMFNEILPPIIQGHVNTAKDYGYRFYQKVSTCLSTEEQDQNLDNSSLLRSV